MPPRGYVTCELCGKVGYYNRKSAKKAAKEQGIHGVSAYQCPYQDSPLFHFGHLPYGVAKGFQSRSEARTPPPRPVVWRRR